MPAESAVKDGLATDRRMGYIFYNASVRQHCYSMVEILSGCWLCREDDAHHDDVSCCGEAKIMY